MRNQSSWSELLPWVCGLVCCAVVQSAHGQSIDWQEDYTCGRASAVALNRPLIVSIHGEDCVACRQLDATTFRDSGVTAAIRQDFVALRLNGKLHANIVAAIKVVAFPVTVFASPDGIILHTVDGYVDAPTMEKHLQEALTRLRKHRAAAPSISQTRTVSAPATPPLMSQQAGAGSGVNYPNPGAMTWWSQTPYWGSSGQMGYGYYAPMAQGGYPYAGYAGYPAANWGYPPSAWGGSSYPSSSSCRG